MLPYLTLWGRLDIPLLPLFILVGLFASSFSFYRLLHRNARYNEFAVFDALLLSSLGGLVVGRLVDILVRFEQFGWNYRAWLNFWVYPALSIPAVFVSGALLFAWLLRRQKITDWELLDYWARACCLLLCFYHLGLFCAGDGLGLTAPHFLGLSFPHLHQPLYPVPLYASLFYLLLSFLLSALENNYRTFDWYRAHRSTAKTGFIFITFILFFGLFSLTMTPLSPAKYHFQALNFDVIISLALIVTSFILVYTHALRQPRAKSSVLTKKRKNA
ncbi:prolipoprotein diacylglyceryl transferase [bacterium]|nr:prolipoprotein diacylglyceryl transferase [bacterium]